MDIVKLTGKVRRFSLAPRENADDAEWAADLQEVVKMAWEAMGTATGQEGNSLMIETCALLCREELFALARPVIPALRTAGDDPNEGAPPSALQREVLRRTTHLRRDWSVIHNGRVVRYEDDETYKEERRIQREAEIFRACVHLCGRGNVSESMREKVVNWLACRPRPDDD